jgi:hypothetical protein
LPVVLCAALVKVAYEAYTGELDHAFSDAFDGNYGALAVSGAKIGIAAASGGVSTVVGAKYVADAVKAAEAVDAGKVATAAAKVAATAASQAATKVTTNGVEGKPLGDDVAAAAGREPPLVRLDVAGDKLVNVAAGQVVPRVRTRRLLSARLQRS